MSKCAEKVLSLKYSRDFMLSFKDFSLPLPAGFTPYKGLMRDDPSLRRRTGFYRLENVQEESSWNDQNGEWNDESNLGLAASKYAVRDNKETDVIRYNRRNGDRNRDYDDGRVKFRSKRLFSEPSMSQIIQLTATKKPKDFTWYYRDMSLTIQGPYEAEDMQKWFKEGYFPPTLMIRREDEPYFQPLLVLIQKVGNHEEPFLTARSSRLVIQDTQDGDQASSSNQIGLGAMDVLSNTRYLSSLAHQNTYNLLQFHTRFLSDHRWDSNLRIEHSGSLTIEDSKPVADSSRLEPYEEETNSDTEPPIPSALQPQWLRDDIEKYSNANSIPLSRTTSSSKLNQEVETDNKPWKDVDVKPSSDSPWQVSSVSNDRQETIIYASNSEPSWAAYASGKAKADASSFVLAPANGTTAKSFREIQQEEEDRNKDKKPEVPAIDQWNAFAKSFI